VTKVGQLSRRYGEAWLLWQIALVNSIVINGPKKYLVSQRRKLTDSGVIVGSCGDVLILPADHLFMAGIGHGRPLLAFFVLYGRRWRDQTRCGKAWAVMSTPVKAIQCEVTFWDKEMPAADHLFISHSTFGQSLYAAGFGKCFRSGKNLK